MASGPDQHDRYERETTTDLDAATADAPRGPALHTRILLGLAVGAVAGVAANAIFGGDHPGVVWFVANVAEPIGTLFIRLLVMIVVPLVFSSLVTGVAGIGDIRRLGRVGAKSFALAFVLSGISVGIGIGLTAAIAPGKRLSPQTAAALSQRYAGDAETRVAAAQKAEGKKDSLPMSLVKTLIPANPVAAVAGETPNMLHLMFFSLLLGVGATLASTAVSAPFLGALDGLFAACTKLIDVGMKLAPYAVACLLFANTARFGIDVLGALGLFIVTVLAGLAIQMFGVYAILVRWGAGMSPLDFFRRVRTVMLTAFSTSSSNATLPTALRVSEENLGVPRQINSFVLTVGATANQNGTALYEGVTVLFLAQLAGVDLSFAQQLTVVYLAILGGIGTAGVPSGSIPFIIGVLATVGVDPASIAIILGVDRLLDMCRTTLNVVGDMAVAATVARSEGYELAGSARA